MVSRTMLIDIEFAFFCMGLCALSRERVMAIFSMLCMCVCAECDKHGVVLTVLANCVHAVYDGNPNSSFLALFSRIQRACFSLI